MRFYVLLVGLLLSFTAPGHVFAATPSALKFPPAAGLTDLTPDPALTLGTLPNGLRYAVRANPEPRGRAALRLIVAAGSLHETEAQRGLAHFLEHMAFNGSTHYAPGTLVEFFQRMGMNFGGDTNAYTSFDRTVYMLDLPDTKPATLAEGFRVLADYAGELLLQPAEIDHERGVVLSEKLARDSADYRAAIAGYEFFYAGTLLPARLPIGIEPVLKTAVRPAFADFYDTWYRPERLAVVAIGDLDPAVVEKQLRELFSPLAARAPARPVPDFGIPATDGPRFGYHYEPEASATTLTLSNIRPPDLSPDTTQKRLIDLPRDLAFDLLNRRLAELAKTESAPFVKATASPDSFPGIHDGAELQLTSRPGKWADTLRVGENELRRALDFGFTAAELREAVASYKNRLEQALKTDATRRSEERADELVEAFIEGTVPTTPAADFALLGPALEKLTPADIKTAFRAAWGDPVARRVAVMGNTRLADTSAAAIALIGQTYAAATAAEVTAPAERTDAAWAYTDFGPAGQIATRKEITDLGITQMVFANGVRVNLKRTEFEADSISLRARVGTGQLTEPRDQPGLAFFGGPAFTAGGLGKHSADELRRILSGRNVGVGLQIGEDALVFTAKTTAADLGLQLQLLTAHLTDPGYREEAQLTVRRQLEPFFARLATQPNGTLNQQVPRRLASGDPRFGLPSSDEALARTLEELRAWLTPQLAGPVELSLVGDLDVDKTLSALSATLGTLPARPAKPALEELRRVATPPPGAVTLPYQGSIAKNLLAVYWPAADARDVGRTRRINLLAEILSDRLRTAVREELGGSYSPQAGNAPSETYRDRGFIVAQVLTDPPEIEAVRKAVLAAAADLAAHGIKDDELIRARQPLLTSLQESERTNAYWLTTVLGAAQEQPWRLDWARSRRADYESITKAELEALARQYLDPARALQFTIVPAPTSAE